MKRNSWRHWFRRLTHVPPACPEIVRIVYVYDQPNPVNDGLMGTYWSILELHEPDLDRNLAGRKLINKLLGTTSWHWVVGEINMIRVYQQPKPNPTGGWVAPPVGWAESQ